MKMTLNLKVDADEIFKYWSKVFFFSIESIDTHSHEYCFDQIPKVFMCQIQGLIFIIDHCDIVWQNVCHDILEPVIKK